MNVEAVIGGMPWSVAVFDREMRYLAHSKSWLEAHGVKDDRNLVGLLHYEVLPTISDDWKTVHARCIAGATERREVDEFRRSDGGREYMRWVVTPWRDDADAIGGVIIYAENITEQMTTRQRLEERDEMIRGLFEKSPLGLNLCRMDGLWIESNPAFLDIIGYTREEADGGLTYWQLTPRSYDADEAVQLEKLRTDRRYGPYEKEFIRKDGTRVPVRLNGFLVERDRETYIWSMIEDLTAQRRLEAAVESERVKAIQTAKLATLGEMAASIAHEINNPLQIIDSYAYLLDGMIQRGQLEEARATIATMREATTRAATIVAGLKRHARKAGAEPETFDLARLAEETVGLWRLRVRSEAIALEVATSPVSIVGRPVEIGQVLMNLLNNAFDAVRGSSDKAIRLSVDTMGDKARLVVEDSGPTIPSEVAAEMFRAFFTTKATGEGTGLGLSISKEIVERHGGTIRLDSTTPTRFVVEFPAVTR